MSLNLCLANGEHYSVKCDLGNIESAIAVKKPLTFIWPTQKRGEIKGAVVSCSCVKKVEFLPKSELNLKKVGEFKTEMILDTSQFKDGEKVGKEIILTVEEDSIYYVHVKVNFSVIDTYSVPSIVMLGEADLGSEHLVKTQLLGGMKIIKKNPNMKITHYNPESGQFKIVIDPRIASQLPWVGVLHVKGEKSEHKINFFISKQQANETK